MLSHGVGDLEAPEAQAALDGPEYVGDDHVETFADRLEHDEVEWNAGQRVRHAEHFAAVRLGRAVTIAFTHHQPTNFSNYHTCPPGASIPMGKGGHVPQYL